MDPMDPMDPVDPVDGVGARARAASESWLMGRW